MENGSIIYSIDASKIEEDSTMKKFLKSATTGHPIV